MSRDPRDTRTEQAADPADRDGHPDDPITELDPETQGSDVAEETEDQANQPGRLMGTFLLLRELWRLVRGEDQRIRVRDRPGLRGGDPSRVGDRKLAPQRCLVDLGGHDRIGHHADPREQIEPSRRSRGEDEPHDAGLMSCAHVMLNLIQHP